MIPQEFIDIVKPVRNMKIGDDVKIFLKGESPWGVVTGIDDEKIKVRITSRLFHELSEIEQAHFMKQEWSTVEKIPNLHGKKQGDEFLCKKLGVGVEPLLNVAKDQIMSNLWINIRFGARHFQVGPDGITFGINAIHLVEPRPKWFEVYEFFGWLE